LDFEQEKKSNRKKKKGGPPPNYDAKKERSKRKGQGKTSQFHASLNERRGEKNPTKKGNDLSYPRKGKKREDIFRTFTQGKERQRKGVAARLFRDTKGRKKRRPQRPTKNRRVILNLT